MPQADEADQTDGLSTNFRRFLHYAVGMQE